MVQIASVWMPFDSHGKPAIAHYPEIIQELRRVFQGWLLSPIHRSRTGS
jgi:DNA topoisomerase VI subunit B